MMKYEPSGIIVREAMTHSPIVCGPDITVKEAVNIMVKNRVGSILIVNDNVKDNKLIGIMTEKDILTKIISAGKEPSKTPIKDVMTKDIISIEKDADINEAVKLMITHDFRRIPVVKNGKLMGLITEKDILRIEPHIMELFITKKKIRETKGKPIAIKEVQGMCEECGNFSEELMDKNGMFVCHNCKYSK